MSKEEGKKNEDPRFVWVQSNVEPVYRNMRTEVFKKHYSNDKTQAAIKAFLDKAECRVLCIAGDRCVATHSAPKELRGKAKGVYFLKLRPFVVKTANIDQVLFGEMAKDPLSHLKTMLQEVYVPLLVNPRNHAGWGEVVSKEVMDKVYGLLANVTITVGQMEGQTTLPLPPMDANATGSNKERIYLLESAVITWTKQIRHVLKQDPELLLKQGFDPTPNMEIAFWQNKASNLNSIFKQLQGTQVRRVLKFLDQSKSTYCSPFAKLCKDVFQARLEANDNVRYLQTLKSWFDHLSDSTQSFPSLIGLFKPILHTILLIWKHSEHYNSAPRLVVLMREICNALINQARQYISGRAILDMIEHEETGRAVEQLRTTLKVCSTFKSTYFDYKAKSSVECPNDAWRIQNTALFFRLDSFLERCHDILELCSTIVQFSKLQRIEIGGTKGKTLTTSVRQVYNDFHTAVSAFQDVPYDIMDIRARRFDDDFYEFRCKIKELERRLGSAITQAFDDSATIYGQFKLLDSFDGLLERPIIHDELEKKHSNLIRAYGEDLALVGDIFLRERALFEEEVDQDGAGGAADVVGRNMPPIAGALGWCAALMERIREPMEKLLKLSKNNRILDEDEGKEVVKIFKGTMGKLEEFEHERIKLLGQDVQTTSLNKLKNHIIVRDPKTKLLSVNFDPSLVRLLREVKYFKLAELEVPEAAASIYKKVETYRQYTGNLDMIVSAYNRVLTSMLPVEAPLLANNIEAIDKTLKMGIEVMNWKSHGIEIFLIEGISKVKKCSDTLDKMKDNVSEIRKFLEHWCRQPLLSRKNKPVSIEIYEQDTKPGITSRYDEIKKGGVAIHKLLMDVNKTLKVSKGLPDWKNFVDFCNEIVVDGLVQLVVQSLDWLSHILDPDTDSVSLPMLEIKVDLVGKEVQFSPEIYHTADGSGVRDVVNKWIDHFVNVGTLFRRLDRGSNAGGGNEEYVKDLIENLDVVTRIAKINGSLEDWETKCNAYRNKFSRYSYLWTSDMNEAMAAFTDEAYSDINGAKVPKLELFDKKLTEFRKERETVDTLYAFEDIGWLRVNAHSIKQALNMWITKWTMAFVGNLSSHVLSTLNNLEEFMTTVREGLQSEIPDGDEVQLKLVMAHIRDVRRRMDATGAMWEPLHECIALLKKHKYPVEDMVVATDIPVQDYLESAPVTWDSTVNLTFLKKEEIFPLQNAAADELKDTISAFYSRLKEFRADFKQHAPFNFSGQPETAYKSLDQYHERLVSLETELVELRNMEDLFELTKTTYHETKDTVNELMLLKRIWDFKAFVELTFSSWKNLQWNDIDTDELEIQTETIKKRMKVMGNEDKIVQAWAVFKDIKKLVTNMAMVLPLVNQLHSPSMRERHWKGVSKVCEVDRLDHSSPTFCLADLLQLRLHLYLEPVQDIVETAAKELKIETKLNKIEAIWAGLALEFVNFKDKEIKIVRVPDEVVEFLEAHTAELQTIVGMGKFVDYFRAIVNKWQSDLGQVEVVLQNWTKVTKQWSSLEAIFLQSEDIRRELPKVTKMFEDVDAKFKQMCIDSASIPNVVDACTREGFESELKSFFVPKLETCQKSLNEYLDMKKKIFPRFYFISNVALLEILSNGNMPRRIMQQISGCFINLKTLKFVDDAGKLVAGMVSNDKEEVPFPKDLELQGQVEYWLNDLLVAMRQALQHITANANASAVGWDVGSEMPRHEWQYQYPAQVVLTCASIQWTDETEQALGDAESGNEDAVKNYENKCTERLFNLIDLVRGKLTKPARTKIITMITMDVHSRDVVHKLAVSRAVSVDCFMWQQQLRFYYHAEEHETDIKICDFHTKYSNEYIGNTGRLVITPLTDRCYITLTMALRLMLGGAPAGPAGTGKTETTKDLARALALPIYVFNCSDQMNFMTLADIFKGLSQAGAWGCFDEFNRIPIEVLSVVATQVKSVLDAIVQLSVPANRPKEYQDKPPGQPPCVVGKFLLNGDEITLVPTTGFFITMNPGYAGRTELPENLKALFRSCAMIRPDLAPICENMLMAEGFKDARPLSVKFVTLYELSSELLSPQCHYDWGLRSVKSVLRVAGLLKRQSPNMQEEKVLMRALRDFNTPKMPNSDIPIFLRLIQDLFPESYQTLPMKDQSLIKITKKVAKNKGLQPDQGFVGKVVEFQELLDVRHSVMLIGPAGSGKTTIINTLLDCWNLGYRQNGKKHNKPIAVKRFVNPKAVTTNELYGYMTLSKEWKDGILSIIMRGMSKNFKELGFNEYQQAKWVCLDGDIDAVWIESMNTVMDSNKVLTLVSNERVPLDDAMRMVFEINSLANATPATVSRAGILYINEEDIGWQPFVDSWVHKFENEQIQTTLPRLFNEYVDVILKTVLKGLKTIVPIRCINQVQTLCYLMESLLKELQVEISAPVLENLFAFSCIWAFGGCLVHEEKAKFSERFLDNFKKYKPFTDKSQKELTVFDFSYKPSAGGKKEGGPPPGPPGDKKSSEFSVWDEMVEAYAPQPLGNGPEDEEFSQVFIQTADTVCRCRIIKLLTNLGRPALLVGTAGTGKTCIIKHFVSRELVANEQLMSSTININYYMDAKMLQTQIEGNLDKRPGSTFGPPGGKKLILFVDDLNLPYIEEYGTQNSLSLFRQLLDHGGMYDRLDLGLYKTIVDVQYLASMNPTAGSFTINERVQRHFATISCSMPESGVLKAVYGALLDGHFNLNNFSDVMKEMSEGVVQASIFLHQQVSKKFMPSATKFVYSWNMRELSNLFRGMLLSDAAHFTRPASFVDLWLHESNRVFADRLVTETDYVRFQEIIGDCAKKHFINYLGDGEGDDVLDSADLPIFTAFHNSDKYEQVLDRSKLKEFIMEQLSEYNESNAIMNLELFQQALEHCTRIVRIIQNRGGSAMLIGVGGSGKQSLSRLSSHICEYPVVTIPVTSGYSVLDFMENLKEYFITAGVKNQAFVLLMADKHVIDERFLVYINDILSSGYIAELFPRDEMDGIFAQNRRDAKANGIMDTPEANLEFFVDRVKANLHVVMCFSPVGDVFRLRARRFPALVNCTAIDWFHPWSRDALVSVASRFLKEVDIPADTKENISHHMAEVHLSVIKESELYRAQSRRNVYATPKSFLELIEFFKQLLAKKREELNKQVNRLGTGLATLEKTATDVAELQEDLKVTMVKVEEKQQATQELLTKMGVQKAETQEQQAKAAVEQEKANKAAADADLIQSQASQELAAAEPLLAAAVAALDCLTKASLTELKAFQRLPSGVEQVTKAVLMMIEGEFKNHKWVRAKKMMARIDNFLARLKDYKHETMEENLITKLTPIVKNDQFTFEIMKNKSLAAANLLLWVVNVYDCNRIYVNVKPLMEKLEKANKDKQTAEQKLQVVNKLVAQVEAQFQLLENSFIQATNDKAKVEAQAKQCKERLDLANRLINGLGSEKDRWGKEIDSLKLRESNLTGDVLLAAAFVSYVGGFDNSRRLKLWKQVWIEDMDQREIALSEGADPFDMLVNDSEIGRMRSEGLPADRISLENGAIVCNCSRWPLLIDPQLQGIKWLRKAFEGDSLKVIQTNNKRWQMTLMNAISNGDCIIIENLGEEVDSAIEPVLARAVVKKGSGYLLKVGSETIDYNMKFKLVLQSRLANPTYLPEIQAQVTMINFIATEKGLEDQLLARVVMHEAAELEERKQRLQAQFNKYKMQLYDLEEQLLERLANAPEDILSDVPLIEGLEKTKATSEEVKEAVKLGQKTEIEINKSRELYRPIANEGAMLYFILTSLGAVDHMYQYSLGAFVSFFEKSMDKAIALDDKKERAVALGERVNNLQESLRLTVYTWVCRGLFEKDKLVLLCQIVFSLMRRGKLEVEFEPEMLPFLIRGPQIGVIESPVEWLPGNCWGAVTALSAFPDYMKLPQDIEDAPSRFQEWFNHVSPETEKLPLDWASLEKKPFYKLLVLRSLRPDRMTVAMADFVRNALPGGSKYVDCDLTLNSLEVLEESFADSSKNVPIYFILSPGTDVVSDLDSLAGKLKFVIGETYHNVSMGQGQDVIAERLLDEAAKSGHWVILNNVHLMPRWLKKLEKILDDFQNAGDTTHEKFRLFLTSDPSKGIPTGILNRSIKLTNEPPTGLKANLKRAFCTFNKATFDEMGNKTRAILFGLCHFHSLMTERKKFGAMGFNMIYPFSLGDLRDSAVCLNNYMENNDSNIPWEDLRYIFGQIMYGGHIVNDIDRTLCLCYLDFIMDDGLLDEMEMFPYNEGEKETFKCPAPTTYQRYLEYIEEELKEETPIAYGLHPNAQIDFRTLQSKQFFNSVGALTPAESDDSGESGGGSGPQHLAENMLNDILERVEDVNFDMAEVLSMLNEEKTPFQNVFLQEIAQMQALVVEMVASLKELGLGFAGELTISDAMDALMMSLFYGTVPTKWTRLAWPSLRSLAAWMTDLQMRIDQLEGWVQNPIEIPMVTWISGLINPQSFLTAIMQQTAQLNSWELDKLYIQTEVTKKTAEQIEGRTRDGAFVSGLALEGARWNTNTGLIEKSKPREMYFPMPVVYCKSNFAASRPNTGIYLCPVYKTRQRGPTYVFSAQLKTKSKTAKWVLGGVALVMDISD